MLWKVLPSFPENIHRMAILQAVLGFLAPCLTIAYLRYTGKITGNLAFFILSACVLNYHFLDFAPMLMSDLPYALLAAISLWLSELNVRVRFSQNASRGEQAIQTSNAMWKRFLPLLLGLCLGAAVTVRMQGLVLVVVSVVYLMLKRCWRAALVATGVAAAVLAPQIIWRMLVMKGALPELSYYTNYVGHAYGTLPALPEFINAWQSSFFWSWRLQINTYFPFLQDIRYDQLPPLCFEAVYRIGYPLLSLPLLVGVVDSFRKRSLPAYYLVLYAISLSVWPVRLEWRHILVVLPIVYYMYFCGCRAFARWLVARVGSYRQLAVKLFMFVSLTFWIFVAGGTTCETLLADDGFRRAMHLPVVAFDRKELDGEFSEAYAWIKDSTTPEAVIVSNNDPRVFLYTGRKSLLPSQMEMWRFASEDLVNADTLLAALKYSRARYIMTEPIFRSNGILTSQINNAIIKVARRYPGLLRAEFTSSAGLIRIFSVDTSKLASRERI